MISRASAGVLPTTIALLMLSVFTVSMGYGVILLLLPYLIERLLGTGGDAARVSRSTGLLTGLYTLSLFLFAPVWGWLSDRHGRRAILLIGFSVTMLTFAIIENITAAYAESFLSGLFAAAVTLVALAAIGNLATEEARGRCLTFVSVAGISGLLLGPMLGVFVAHSDGKVLLGIGTAGSLALPLVGTLVLALLMAVATATTVLELKRAGTSMRDQFAAKGCSKARTQASCRRVHRLSRRGRVLGKQTAARAWALPWVRRPAGRNTLETGIEERQQYPRGART